MAERDLRDVAQLARPGDLLEKSIGVRDVRLDLAPLAVVEVAPPDHQELELLIAEQLLLESIEVGVHLAAERGQLLRAALGQDGRLVRLRYYVDEMMEALALRFSLGGHARAGLCIAVHAVGEKILGAFPLELEVGGLHQIGKAVPDQLEVCGIKFLLLHENLLADADLSE